MEPRHNGPLSAPVFGDLQVTDMKVGHVTQPEDRQVPRRLRPDERPLLMDGDMLDVTNDSSQTIAFRWARKTYAIEPGQQGFVVFEALADALGDPRSQDGQMTRYDDGAGNRGIVPNRYDELCRMFARYGVKNESMDELAEKAPRVRVTTLHGQPVVFPAVNPASTAYPVANADEGNVSSDVSRMFTKATAENAELRDRLERLEAALEATYIERENAPSASE